MVGYSEIAGTPMLVKHISNWSVPLWMEINRICLNTCRYVNMCLGNWDAPRKSFLVWWGMVCLTGRSRWREYKQGLCTLYIGGFSDNHQYHLDWPAILFFFFRFSQNVFNCLSVLYIIITFLLEIYSQTWKNFWNVYYCVHEKSQSGLRKLNPSMNVN